MSRFKNAMPESNQTMRTEGISQLRRTNRWCAVALVLWLLPLVVISTQIIVRPAERRVTPLYHQAVQSWWSSQPLYRGPAGMNYLPQFALLFGPYHLVGLVVGDLLWVGSAAAGLAAGLWLFCGVMPGGDRMRTFAMVSAISLPLCLPALQFGQANAHLAAVLLLAAWCLQAQRWNAAAALLWLATCIKPLGLAAIGLAFAAYPLLGWRLALGLPVFLGFPFLFASPEYVWSQYLAAFDNLRKCSEVATHRFADLNGLLRTFGAPLTGKASLVARALSGALLMLVCWRAPQNRHVPPRSLIWLVAAAGYLMLFNPMTEENSYAILAPVLGLLSQWAFSHDARAWGWLFIGMALTMGLSPELLRPLFHNSFALAWHPAMTLLLFFAMGWRIFKPSPLAVHEAQPRTPAP